MKGTLYNQMQKIEGMDEDLRELNSSNKIDVHELQGKLFKQYHENPILMDAIKGRQTLEESLEELGHINKGIRKILPWRKDKIHNKRVNQIGKLISKPYHLYTSGIFTPDNIVTTGAYILMAGLGFSYLFGKIFVPQNTNMDPEEFQRIMFAAQWVIPTAMSTLLIPTLGALTNWNRFTKLPTEEAKYLDTKVKEFYK